MTTHEVVFLLFDLAGIILLARLLGAVARLLGQPAVIGEVLAGILLGPTVLGPSLSTAVFPLDTRPFLTALGNIAIALLMFVVGLELDPTLLRGRGGIAATVSVSAIMAPFGLGAALALLISGQYSGAHRLEFVLLIAVAMSVTAFPVLARILTDSGLHRTRLGSLALACAAVDDVLAWSLLAVVVALTGGADAAGWPILLLPAYLVMMFLGVRPLLRRLIATEAKSGPNHQVASGSAVSVIVAGVLISGGLCQWMGLHLLFGAFLFGGMFPRKGTELFRAKLRTHVNEFNSMLLLPAFFVIAGLGVNVTGLGLAGFGELGLVLLVAIGGKMGGTFVGARLHCLPVRQSVALAVLMNTRGLTELVILSAGRQLGLLDQRLYSIMVLMAVLTTMMAGPLLRVTYRVTAAPTNDQVRRAS